MTFKHCIQSYIMISWNISHQQVSQAILTWLCHPYSASLFCCILASLYEVGVAQSYQNWQTDLLVWDIPWNHDIWLYAKFEGDWGNFTLAHQYPLLTTKSKFHSNYTFFVLIQPSKIEAWWWFFLSWCKQVYSK